MGYALLVALTAIAAYFLLRHYRVGPALVRPNPAMNRRLLDTLDYEMDRQMRVCDKNIANEAGDAADEQILKNVFMSFQHRLRELRRDPVLEQMLLSDLSAKLNSISGDIVANWGYRSGKWANELLLDTIGNARQTVEQLPLSEFEIECPNTSEFAVACPECATPLLVERDYDGFTVRGKGIDTQRDAWSSISSATTGSLDVFGSCPVCRRQVTISLGATCN